MEKSDFKKTLKYIFYNWETEQLEADSHLRKTNLFQQNNGGCIALDLHASYPYRC